MQLAPFSWVVPFGVPKPVTGSQRLTDHQIRFRHRLAHILLGENRFETPVNKLANTLSVNGLNPSETAGPPPLIEVIANHGITFHNPAEIATSLQCRHRNIGPTTQEKINRLMLCLCDTNSMGPDLEL